MKTTEHSDEDALEIIRVINKCMTWAKSLTEKEVDVLAELKFQLSLEGFSHKGIYDIRGNNAKE